MLTLSKTNASVATPYQNTSTTQISGMPLSMASLSEKVKVQNIRGKDETKMFLKNLGFVEDAVVEIVSELNGNVIVSVKGTRVAISKSMASRILTQNVH